MVLGQYFLNSSLGISKIMESLPEKNKWLHEKRTIIRNIAVILLQIVTLSPWTRLVKNHESKSRTNESQLKKK